jgi:HD-like signal output (HDOD) protein
MAHPISVSFADPLMHKNNMTENPPAGPNPEELAQILGQGIIIPPQPRVLTEIDSLVRRANVSVKAVATLVSQDPGIVAGIFRIVNSPAMGLSRRIDTVDSAISVLGITQVTNIIKSIAIRQALSGNAPAFELFWERSGEIAQIAAAIAIKCESVINIHPGQAYMAGLFHDCGVPVLLQRFPQYCKEFRTSSAAPWPNLATEDAALHTDHCVVGYLVSKQWSLPEFIQGAVRYHHEILAVVHPARTIVALLQLATHLYCVQRGLTDEKEWVKSRRAILEELGIHEEGLNEFSEDVIDQLNG